MTKNKDSLVFQYPDLGVLENELREAGHSEKTIKGIIRGLKRLPEYQNKDKVEYNEYEERRIEEREEQLINGYERTREELARRENE